MKAISTILIFFISCCGMAQSSIDSLRVMVAQLDSNSVEYVSIQTLLAKEYAETNPEKAIRVAKRALLLAKNDSIKGQIFVAYSSAFGYMANYDSSTHYCFKALEIAELNKDTVTLIDANNNIGINFMYQEEDAKAIAYYERVEELSRLFGDSLRLGHALTNLGIMYSYAEDYEKELIFYERAAKIFLAIGEKDGLGNTYLNAASTYTILKEYDKAESLLEQSLQLFTELDFSSGIQNSIQTMAENELAKGNYLKAEELGVQALEIAKKNQLNQDVIFTYELLEKINLEAGNFKKAHQFLILGNNEKDQIFTLEKNKQINELETKYETEKKEAEIKRLALENDLKDSNLRRSRNAQLTLAVGGTLVIIILFLFFSLRSKKQKAEKEAQELQMEALQKRLLDLNATPTDLQIDLEDLNSKLQSPLSEREFEALQLSLNGKTNAEIAEKLFISVSTVKFHFTNIYGKLGVSNRKEALDYVVKES